ncbi:amidase [Phenylobacterium montanum]|uniref:Amidase n=1 Tax=Phenylobacterium montanum TaxID=2823693 RepID=A0A975FW91_9CAUL|nr:amidase [Caulobacter sp. S6]QUD86455.1 amidase [Caulobacter sp. S6]
MDYLDAHDTLAELEAGRVSAMELAEAAIARIEARDGEINAVVVRDFERALEAAGAADAARARGERRPLLGLPMTVKEGFNIAGLPTTWGLPGTEGLPVPEDAVGVRRLKAAGAVVLGKTNAPTMLSDWQTANPVYGLTRNPWDLERTPGGSSGGGAAALAAGFTSLEFGSDLAASLRAPAAFCGVFAHKPSHGLVPQRGFAPPGAPAFSPAPAIDLAVVGPMARSARDLALALDATAGSDEREAVGYRLALPPPRHERLGDYRVLVVDAHPLLPTEPGIRARLHEVAGALEREGCRVVRDSKLLPDLSALSELFMTLLISQISADMPAEAFAGAQAAAAGLPADVRGVEAAGLRGRALSHRDWIAADRQRAGFARAFTELFGDFDVVLCPSMPVAAFRHRAPEDEGGTILIDGTRVSYFSLPLWCVLASTTGNPATCLPVGLDAAGLPIGVQVVGPFLEDRTCLRCASLLEKVIGGFQRPPGW